MNFKEIVDYTIHEPILLAILLLILGSLIWFLFVIRDIHSELNKKYRSMGTIFLALVIGVIIFIIRNNLSS